MSLDQMIHTADLVVAGSIDQASTDRITLRVTDRIAGPQIGDSVTIKRNKDWSGRKGPGVFRAGQRLLVFATKSKARSESETPSWRTIGFENEGVLAIDAGCVLLGRSTRELQGGDLRCERDKNHRLSVRAFRLR